MIKEDNIEKYGIYDVIEYKITYISFIIKVYIFTFQYSEYIIKTFLLEFQLFLKGRFKNKITI